MLPLVDSHRGFSHETCQYFTKQVTLHFFNNGLSSAEVGSTSCRERNFTQPEKIVDVLFNLFCFMPQRNQIPNQYQSSIGLFGGGVTGPPPPSPPSEPTCDAPSGATKPLPSWGVGVSAIGGTGGGVGSAESSEVSAGLGVTASGVSTGSLVSAGPALPFPVSAKPLIPFALPLSCINFPLNAAFDFPLCPLPPLKSLGHGGSAAPLDIAIPRCDQSWAVILTHTTDIYTHTCFIPQKNRFGGLLIGHPPWHGTARKHPCYMSPGTRGHGLARYCFFRKNIKTSGVCLLVHDCRSICQCFQPLFQPYVYKWHTCDIPHWYWESNPETIWCGLAWNFRDNIKNLAENNMYKTLNLYGYRIYRRVSRLQYFTIHPKFNMQDPRDPSLTNQNQCLAKKAPGQELLQRSSPSRSTDDPP